jgi:hypothetical protein
MDKQPIYSEKEIQIVANAVTCIRERPEMFVGGDPTGARLAARVVEDLLLLDAGPVRIARNGSWYLISAERDWLMSEDGIVSFESFHRLVPMPSGGRFYDRAEVVLTALADAVVTSGIDGTTWISGEPARWKLPNDVSLPPQYGRVVAFHFAKA